MNKNGARTETNRSKWAKGDKHMDQTSTFKRNKERQGIVTTKEERTKEPTRKTNEITQPSKDNHEKRQTDETAQPTSMDAKRSKW